jgi:hypothetical protein
MTRFKRFQEYFHNLSLERLVNNNLDWWCSSRR